MNLERIFTRWTHCYHITAVVNLRGLRQSRALFPASTLLRRMDHGHLVNIRRTHDVQLRFQDQEILIRNQVPLDPEQIELGPAETLQGYVACLNSHVFFWPGTSLGPTFDGVRMIRSAAGVKSAVIRVPSRALLEANEGSIVRLSTCNSGAAWRSKGKKSRRGTGVFQPATSFSEHPKRIEEILFHGSVNLPDDTECSIDVGQAWWPLFAQLHDRTHTLRSSSKNEPW